MADVQKEILDSVEEATSKGVFNILDAIAHRAYPHADVNVFLNEELAYNAAIIEEQIDELEKLGTEDSLKESDVLSKKLNKMIDELESSKYVFSVYGISEGEREDLNKIAIEKFPIEYEETKNPFTGEPIKTEIKDIERDRHFTNLLWAAQIRKIKSPDGGEQERITLKDVEELRRSLPIAGIAAINEAVEKVRAATAVFMAKVNEDFLAKS